MSQKPVIFLTFTNDRNGQFLEALRPERDGIIKYLNRLQSRDEAIIVEPGMIDTDKLLEGLNAFTGKISIFHFSGHANSEGIQLESEDGQEIFLHGSNLTQILSGEAKEGLKLVFLNACMTQGLVQALQRIGIPAIIATAAKIPDATAKRFAIAFYRSLASGNSLETAFEQSKAVIEPGKAIRRVYRDRLGSTKTHVSDLWGLHILEEKILSWKLTHQDPLADLPPIPSPYYQKLPKEPFRNLLSFENQHAGIFFGRGEEIHTLYQRINSIYPIILFYGQTGVGKSSLLDAGLLPRLEREYEVRYERREEAGLLDTLQALLEVTDINSIPLRWLEIEEAGKPLIVILDQLEEAFTKNTPSEAEAELNALFSVLAEVFESQETLPEGRIILSYRKEYHSEIERITEAYSLAYTKLPLERLNRKGIVEAIEGITRNEYTRQKYGLQIESSDQGELPGIIADDLLEDAESALAPVLQILLSRLWAHAPDKHFRIALYQQLKKEGLLLQDFFDRQMEQLKNWNEAVVESGLVLDVLDYHTTSLGTAANHSLEDISARYSHQQALLPELLQQCTDAYLLHSTEEGSYRLSHDTLAPIIQKAHEESDKAGQRAVRILESKQYNSSEEVPLLDESDLRTVEMARNGMRAWRPLEELVIQKSKIQIDERKNKEILQRKNIIINQLLAYAMNVQKNDISLPIRLLQLAAKILTPTPPVILQAIYSTFLKLSDPAFYYSMGIGSGHQVDFATYSPDGAHILTICRDHIVRIYSKHADIVTILKGHTDEIKKAVYSPDGQYILTVSNDEKIILWTNNGKIYRELIESKYYISLSHNSFLDAGFFPDGKHIFVSDGQHFSIWNMNGEQLPQSEEEIHESQINCISISPNGEHILTSSDDHTIRFWNIQGTVLKTIDNPHKGVVYSAIYAPDGKRILSIGQDGLLKVWNENGRFLKSHAGHSETVTKAIFSPDGKYILSISDDETMKLWTLRGKVIADIPLGAHRIYEVVFSPDCQRILTASEDKTARLWSLKGELLSEFSGHQYYVDSACFSPNGKQMLTACGIGSARLWSLGTDMFLNLSQHKKRVKSAVFSPDGTYILTVSANIAYLWNRQGELLHSLINHFEEDPGYFIKDDISAHFSPDGKTILTISEERQVKLWDLKGEVIVDFNNEIASREKRIVYLKNGIFSPDGQTILMVDSGQQFHSWNLAQKKYTTLSLEIDNDHGTGSIDSFIFSPDGSYLLTRSSTYKNLYFQTWDLAGNLLSDTFEDTESISRMGFCPNGRYFYAEMISSFFEEKPSDLSFQLWSENEKGDPLLSLTVESTGKINKVAFAPNSEYFATISKTGTKVWDTNGNLLTVLDNKQGLIHQVNFSPDSKYLLTALGDNTAKLWNLEGDLLAEWTYHTNEINSAIFSPDGSFILTCSNDRTAKLAPIPQFVFDWLKTAPMAQLSKNDRNKYGIDTMLDFIGDKF